MEPFLPSLRRGLYKTLKTLLIHLKVVKSQIPLASIQNNPLNFKSIHKSPLFVLIPIAKSRTRIAMVLVSLAKYVS